MAIKRLNYEIATYGGLVQIAETIGRNDIARVLHETLDEEKASDELLTTIAEGHINQDAFHEKNQ
jgi:ferritin-like metal-binding protein YciE